jgi:hypothetical protein
MMIFWVLSVHSTQTGTPAEGGAVMAASLALFFFFCRTL